MDHFSSSLPESAAMIYELASRQKESPVGPKDRLPKEGTCLPPSGEEGSPNPDSSPHPAMSDV